MVCDYNYCIYNKDLKCILDEIEVAFNGHCLSCIVVNISDEMLDFLKKKQLAMYQQEERTYKKKKD